MKTLTHVLISSTGCQTNGLFFFDCNLRLFFSLLRADYIFFFTLLKGQDNAQPFFGYIFSTKPFSHSLPSL